MIFQKQPYMQKPDFDSEQSYIYYFNYYNLQFSRMFFEQMLNIVFRTFSPLSMISYDVSALNRFLLAAYCVLSSFNMFSMYTINRTFCTCIIYPFFIRRRTAFEVQLSVLDSVLKCLVRTLGDWCFNRSRTCTYALHMQFAFKYKHSNYLQINE